MGPNDSTGNFPGSALRFSTRDPRQTRKADRGSQCLVAGAEGIRTGGLFWVFCSWETVGK